MCDFFSQMFFLVSSFYTRAKVDGKALLHFESRHSLEMPKNALHTVDGSEIRPTSWKNNLLSCLKIIQSPHFSRQRQTIQIVGVWRKTRSTRDVCDAPGSCRKAAGQFRWLVRGISEDISFLHTWKKYYIYHISFFCIKIYTSHRITHDLFGVIALAPHLWSLFQDGLGDFLEISHKKHPGSRHPKSLPGK